MVHQQRPLPGLRRANRQVFFERLGRFRSIRHLAFLSPLAAHANPALGHVDIVEVHARKFADAQPAAIEQLKHQQIALRVRALERVLRHAVHQAVLVCSAVGTRGSRAGARSGSPHQACDVRRDYGPFAQHELEQRPDGGQFAADRVTTHSGRHRREPPSTRAIASARSQSGGRGAIVGSSGHGRKIFHETERESVRIIPATRVMARGVLAAKLG